MSFDNRVGDAVILTAPGAPSEGPLRADDGDVSWLPKCRVGDDQGNDGACSIFAFANWCEVMLGANIGDRACLGLYFAALDRFGRPQGAGLTFGEAFLMVQVAGWLPAGVKGLRRVKTLDPLASQPLLAAYKVTPAWTSPNRAGCLDHRASGDVLGYHAVLIVGHGRLPGRDMRWVWIENSWGIRWGWNGIGVMTENLHRELCAETWEIVL